MDAPGSRRRWRAGATAVLGALLALAAGPAPAAERAWSFTVDAEAFAEGRPVPVHGFFDDYGGTLGRGSDAVLRSRGEVTAGWGAFSLSYVQRYDYEIRASRDAAVLYYRIRNDQAVAREAPYAVDLDAYANRRDGVQVGYRFEGANWSLAPKLSVYRGLDLIDGRLQGVASADADEAFTYDATVDYVYRKDVLFEREFRQPRGTGVGLDLLGRWSPLPRLDLDVALHDVVAWLWWQQVPGTRADAISATAERDAEGRLTVRPTLSGREFARDYAQRIHPEFRLAAGWALDAKTRLEASGRFTEVKPYGALAASRTLAPWLRLRGEVLPRERALGLGLTAGPLTVFAMSDSVHVKRAHVLGLRLRYSQTF